MATLEGGCHCRQVRFTVRADPVIRARSCNCSICRMSGYLHMIVGRDSFTLLRGEDCLSSYRFNSGIAEHLFCRECGVKAFYVPRSHPEGISVNVNCLDREGIEAITVTPFDGLNWEQNIHKLSPISD